jgi:hypothetical protein
MAPDPRCFCCKEVETVEHLLCGCDHYLAKVWALLGCSMTLAISHHTGDYISNLVLTPLEIVFNKPHPLILLHIKADTRHKILHSSSKKKLNETSFTIMHSCRNIEDRKNCTHLEQQDNISS